ncbi:MAG: DUF3142 domain-containing protein [Candidatus Hydrogenedens sp.]|nr:DUF3142 domain-containing protein [Candidatus Hydrogenedens sp.]
MFHRRLDKDYFLLFAFLNDEKEPVIDLRSSFFTAGRVETVLLLFYFCPALIAVPTVAQTPDESRPQYMYIWQRHWTEEMPEAIHAAADSTQGFLVLSGEIEGSDAGWRFHPVNVDWASLAATEKKLWLALRVHSRALDQRQWNPSSFARLLHHLLEKAEQAGASLKGVQIDYDAATEQLPQYQAWLEALRRELPQQPLSITGLPDWLNHKTLPSLVAGLDDFVLQLHSLEVPEDPGGKPLLFDPEKAASWIRQAQSLKIPFSIALPTYGWRIVFDENNEIKALEAEESVEYPVSWTHKEIAADPSVLAPFVQQLQEDPPVRLKALHWFRMPLPSDSRNWSLETLRLVMAGEVPQPVYEAQLRQGDKGLVELWIIADRLSGRKVLCLQLELISGKILAADLVNGFYEKKSAQDNIIMISGPVHTSGKDYMAGWWLLGSGEHEKAPSLAVKEIGSCP